MKLFATLAASILAALTLSHCSDNDINLTDIEFSDTLVGETPTEKYLKGKIVVVEYWGTKCPPCIASLPQLAQMDKELRNQGLVIIGAEMQGSTDQQIKKATDNANVEYTITKGASNPANIRSIPTALVFNSSGNKIFQGSPHDEDFKQVIKQALKEINHSESSP